jgi:hypothetical protein
MENVTPNPTTEQTNETIKKEWVTPEMTEMKIEFLDNFVGLPAS